MASPTIESLCCISSRSPFTSGSTIDNHTIIYYWVSLVASIFGIAGAAFQILPREPVSGYAGHHNRLYNTKGRLIIKWLALADLMAAIGIFIRSICWVADNLIVLSDRELLLSKVLCVITSGWTHYFYTATYFWTFIYAIDVMLVLNDNKVNHRLYHGICWTMPALLCLTGLLILYLPDLTCRNNSSNPYLKFLPNYLSTFIPIVIVMLGNPVLYCVAFSRVENLLSSRGRFTQTERRVVDGLRKKFLLINFVFYLCWLPNIISGMFMCISSDVLPNLFIRIIWYLMAVLNPLQAVFNSMVYRSWDSLYVIKFSLLCQCCIDTPSNEQSYNNSQHGGYLNVDYIDQECSSDDDDHIQQLTYLPDVSLINRPWQRILHFTHVSENTPLLCQTI